MGCPLSALSGGKGSALPEPYRVAVYYAPDSDDLLWQAGCEWLGRDPLSNAALSQPNIPSLFENSTDPRRYGLHATLKAPITPRHGFKLFLDDAAKLAAKQVPFALPRLQVTNLHGFLALCPAETSELLQILADRCVTQLDSHRLPENAEAQAKRAAGRSSRQAENIVQWGYPLVLEDFRFHMTLTNKMAANPYEAAASAHFAAALALPRMVSSLAIFIEEEKGQPFRLYDRLAFLA